MQSSITCFRRIQTSSNFARLLRAERAVPPTWICNPAHSQFYSTEPPRMPKVFLTGATGYIGGSVFATIAKKHPEYDVTVLLRKPPTDFSSKFPNVKVVLGDFESAEKIASASANSHIAIHCGNSDHEGALNAIIRGLLKRDSPSYLLHLSGTGLLYDFQDTRDFIGQFNPKIYSDIDDIDEITSRPATALHRKTDSIVLEAGTKHGDKLKTAIVCPPDICGRGHGPGRQQSIVIPLFVDQCMKVGAPFYVNEGSNARGWVHVDDLMTIYLGLIEAAVAGGGSVSWGKQGYFLAANQEYSQKQISEAVARVLHKKGVFPTAKVKQVSEEQVANMFLGHQYPDLGFFSFASNSRSRGDRAAKEFGYKPSALSLMDTIEGDVMDALATRW